MDERVIKRGDLVKWFLAYDVGLVKDAGYGIVVSVFENSYYGETYNTYRVYRNEHEDIMIFEKSEIEII